MSDASTHNGHTERGNQNAAQNAAQNTADAKLGDEKAGDEKAGDERAYLDDETEATKQAIVDDIQRLKSSLADAVDPIAWAKEHPWISLALAVAAGFTAGAVLNPFGERSSHEEPQEEEFEEEEQPQTAKPKRRARSAARHPSLTASAMGMIFEPLFEMVKVALTSLLVASVKRYTDPTYGQPIWNDGRGSDADGGDAVDRDPSSADTAPASPS